MSRRLFSTGTQYAGATFRSFGSVKNVLKLEQHGHQELGRKDIRVKILAAPIHPQDVAIISGWSPVRPSFPAVGGTECVAVVEEVGGGVTGVAKGDLVVPKSLLFAGSWRQFATTDVSNVLKLDSSVTAAIEAAKEADMPESEIWARLSTASVAPVTAKALLSSFGALKAGDVVVQNAANSLVGIFVTQYAAQRGLKTVNILRRGPNYDEEQERVKAMGGYVAVGDDYVNTLGFAKLLDDLAPAKLGLNATGGKLATAVARSLGNNGTMVTYGGMSRDPVVVPTSTFISHNIALRGFWLSNYIDQNPEEYARDVNAAAVALLKGELRTWLDIRKFSHFWVDGWAAHVDATNTRKIVLLNQQ